MAGVGKKRGRAAATVDDLMSADTCRHGPTEVGDGIGARELFGAASAFLMLLFLIKVYGVARYSLTTTTGLLTASPTQVVLGTVTIYAYYVLPALAVGTLWFAVRYRRRIRWSVWPVIVIVATVAALASPFEYLRTEMGVVAAAFVAELALHVFLSRRSRLDFRPGRTSQLALSGLQGMMIVYFAAGLLALQFLASLDAPWVSAQAFRLDRAAVVSTQQMTVQEGVLDIDSERVFVGYPISEENGWLTVLHADTRYLMRFPTASVMDRLTCHNEADQLHGDRPLLAAIQGAPYNSHNIDCRLVADHLKGIP